MIWDGDAAAGTAVFDGVLCDSPGSVTAQDNNDGRGTVFKFNKPLGLPRCEAHGLSVGGSRYTFKNNSTYYLGWDTSTNTPDAGTIFQRKIGSTRGVISPQTVLHILARRCTDLAQHHPAFRSVKFTPHDFRRIFTTELVNSGLPIHIGATLLGHLNIQTTRGYVAVFDEDVIRHYLAHLNERRQLRPDHEYRDVTSLEWDEFEEHFDKRKVELGACGRPYGTPCQHEHACIRCPMLQVSPTMTGRLDDLEADLINRRTRAQAEGWAGEIEGLDLTLQLLRAKRNDTRRRAQRPTVNLGIPRPRA